MVEVTNQVNELIKTPILSLNVTLILTVTVVDHYGVSVSVESRAAVVSCLGECGTDRRVFIALTLIWYKK